MSVALPFEFDAIERSVEVLIEDVPISFCTPEDLILHKIISKRDKDMEDVQSILNRRNETLDFEYLEPRIDELSTLQEKPDILTKWHEWKKSAK